MVQLEGYTVKDTIIEGKNSLTLHGVRDEDNVPVVIKWIRDDKNYERNLRIMKNEFGLGKLIDSSGTVKSYSLLEAREGAALILEDFGGTALRMLLEQSAIPDLSRMLEIMISVTSSLAGLHHANIIHKDVNPGNIIVNPDNWRVKLTDLGISTLLGREQQHLIAAERLEGTLAYISPEQTGRMNRAIDYRTDFYSLGVTMFEMLTGALPFQAADPIGFVHCHIAVTPDTVLERNPEIPEMLSHIVRKLMAKNAEERYLSGAGLKADLEECLRQFRERGAVQDFTLGSMDVSSQFNIPQKLYGREKEIEVLMNDFFSAADGGSELLLVAGYSGIGKSSLVHEVHRPIVEKRGYFISGKYDQFSKNIPYTAVIQAFRELIEQLVTEKEETLEVWKENLLEALGPNGQVIVDVIPEVELIIGKQPAVQNLGPAETQNRFNFTFLKFISVFTRKEHPLVIFLDDLQWADSASLKLIKTMMGNTDSRYFLLIGAYRDNEVDANHPFIRTVEEIKELGAEVNTLTLSTLDKKTVHQLVGETLSETNGRVSPLVDLVIKKTDGNPFFVNEFLKALHRDDLLQYDPARKEWVWDSEKIEAQGITDNVVDLMVGRMQRLPENTRKIMQLGACIGASFDIHTLSIVSRRSPETVAEDMRPAVVDGLLIPSGEAKDILKGGVVEQGSVGPVRAAHAVCRFQHDRVQQASYSTIPESERETIHLEIGRLLLANTAEDKMDESLFVIMEQLNKGRNLIEGEEERMQLVESNCEAGIKAKSATAYGPAVEHFRIAVEFLPANPWQTTYDLTFKIYTNFADAQYLAKNQEEVMPLFDLLLANAATDMEKAGVYMQILAFYDNSNRYIENGKAGIEALKLFGIELPPLENEDGLGEFLGKELEEYETLMNGRAIKDLESLPVMTDGEQIGLCNILNLMFAPALFISQNLLGFVVVKMINATIKYGKTDASGFGFVWFGIIRQSIFKDFEGAYQAGQLGQKIVDEFHSVNFFCKVLSCRGIFLDFWYKHHIKESLPLYKEALKYGLETGDLPYSCYSGYAIARDLILISAPLEEAEKEIAINVELMRKLSNPGMHALLQIFHHCVLRVMGVIDQDFSLSSDDLDEDVVIKGFKDVAFLTAVGHSHLFKLRVFMHFANHDKLLELAEESLKFIGFVAAQPQTMNQFLVQSLALCGKFSEYPEEQRQGAMTQIEANQVELKLAADNSPLNFKSMFLLVEAERQRVLGLDNAAMDLYDQAILAAQEGELMDLEALSNKLAGEFWLGRGKSLFAAAHMTEAHRLYRRWGAGALVEEVERKYPDLIKRQRTVHKSGPTSTTTGDPLHSAGTSLGITTSQGVSSMDINTVLKASHSIADEIRLESLLEKMMRIVMENAGAQSGFLIQVNEKGEAIALAQGDLSRDEVLVERRPLSELEKGDSSLAATVVRYTARMKKSVIISDAVQDEKFSQDPYIQKNKPRSILSAPISHQGRLTGVIYLENNISTGAFTPSRLEVINLLSSQAAISIENAGLYANLEEKVEERTAELRTSKKEIDDIFSNVEQGLMTINPNFTVSSEFSRKIKDIFERDDLGGMKFENFFLGNAELQASLKDFLEQLFTNSFMSMALFERANPLKNFPYTMVNREKESVTKILDFKFSRIFETDEEGRDTKVVQKIMVVIDDKTEEYKLQKELEKKAEEQAGKVEKLYQILQLSPEVFRNFISESAATLNQVHDNLKSLGAEPARNKSLLEVVFREVHTLKGNARALNLDSIARTAHELEDIFEELKEKPQDVTEELKEKTFAAVAELINQVQDGDSLFKKILNMQSALESKPADPMGEFEERFRSIVEREAKESEKSVGFIFENKLEGPPSESILNKLKDPLSHIIRNSVSHGIENSEERRRLGKSEQGHVTLRLTRIQGKLTILCEDDGGGLDLNKIKEKAAKLNLYSMEELNGMSDIEIKRLIFSSGLSTRDTVSDGSGRGVGMAAVKEDLKALKAVIRIGTKPNRHTRFTIQIPEK